MSSQTQLPDVARQGRPADRVALFMQKACEQLLCMAPRSCGALALACRQLEWCCLRCGCISNCCMPDIEVSFGMAVLAADRLFTAQAQGPWQTDRPVSC